MEDLNEKKQKTGIYEKYVKRLIDILCSGCFLLLFCWLYAVLAILVMVKLGSPVIFKQTRPGKDAKLFNMYKFRTMTDQRDENGKLLPDEVRLTRFGKILRSTSLDELPELVNIFKGDMSIIGPRPLLVEYLPRYNKKQAQRHMVRPGLTGYAQANGRNSLSWEEKFDMDVYYVHNVSFKFDTKIIIDTIKTVFKREGISSATAATMEPFMGTPEPDETEEMNERQI